MAKIQGTPERKTKYIIDQILTRYYIATYFIYLPDTVRRSSTGILSDRVFVEYYYFPQELIIRDVDAELAAVRDLLNIT